MNFENENLQRNCFRQQIDELEMISSSFCNPGEFFIDDHSTMADVNEYLDAPNDGTALPNIKEKLDFLVTVKHDACKVEIKCILPHLYPAIEQPDVRVRSMLIPKTDEQSIRSAIECKMIELRGVEEITAETYLFETILWIIENIRDLIAHNSSRRGGDDTATVVHNNVLPPIVEVNRNLARLWIYSHHIRCTAKRQAIIKTAENLNLTGFSLVGKPGVICVEGTQTNAQYFYKTIKSMQWQRLQLKHEELVIVDDTLQPTIESFRKFTEFTEHLLCACRSERGMDMAGFFKYLDGHNFQDIKTKLFDVK